MLYSARDEKGFALTTGRLGSLMHGPLTAEASARAVSAQAELAATPGVSHRVKPVNLLIAAVAALRSSPAARGEVAITVVLPSGERVRAPDAERLVRETLAADAA